MKSLISLSVVLSVLCVSPAALAFDDKAAAEKAPAKTVDAGKPGSAKVTEKEATDLFWTLVEHVNNEDNAYFDVFVDTAKISYVLPASYGMEGGKLTLDEFKQVQQAFWSYTENYSYDVDTPVVTIKDGEATIKVDFFERYTLYGATYSSIAKQVYVVKKLQGKLKVVEFSSDLKNADEAEYQSAKKNKANEV